MREILFRGKRIDGKEWVEGYFANIGEKSVIILEEEKYSFNMKMSRMVKGHDLILVGPETVCQYTGLTDKNGRKIFEGDIVSAPFVGYDGKTRERKGVVEFANGAFSVNWKDSEEYGKNFAGYVNDIEVIGNIFDNPKLIGDQP